MKISMFAYSRRGIHTAEKIMLYFSGNLARLYVPERFSDSGHESIPKPSESFYGEQFKGSDALIFISSCGIAVRTIAAHIQNKLTDPAVLCIDEMGTFVIPILSGHIGGANELAKKLALMISAVPVITTATDINGRFSVDSWAVRNGYLIDDMTLAKEVSAAILEQNIPLFTSLPITSNLPNGLISGETGEIGIYIGWDIQEPFAKTLRLIPRVLHLGIGCRKGTSAETIREAVSSIFTQNKIDKRAVKCAASIDLKASEQGLLEYCATEGIPINFYNSDKLMSLPGTFTRSEFVEKVTGADNVCERAAMIGAAKLIVKKTAGSGVTAALAAEKTEVNFE